MSWFDDVKKNIEEMLSPITDKKSKIYIPKVHPRRQAIVELIRELRKAETPEAKDKILDALTDFDKNPKDVIWQVIHGITTESAYGYKDKSYIEVLVWRLNDLGAGRYFVAKRCNYNHDAHEIVSAFSEQALCGLIEGLTHRENTKYSSKRDGFNYFAPLLICLGPRIIPILEYHLHSNRLGLSEEVAIIIAAIKTLWNDNGKKAAVCFIDNEVYKSRGSLQIINSFNAEAMRCLIRCIRGLKEMYERRGIKLANPLCERLIEAKEKSLPFLQEAAASDQPETAEEAAELIRAIETT